MGEDAEFIAHVIPPYDVGIGGSDFAAGIFRLIDEWALVLLGQSIGGQAEHFAAVGDDIQSIAVDGGGTAQADVFGIAHLAGREFGDGQLPEEFSGGFVKAHHYAQIACAIFVARGIIVGAEEDFPARDRRVAETLTADFCHPLHVFGGGGVDLVFALLRFAGIKRGGRSLFRRDHVPRAIVPPLGPIPAEGRRGKKDNCKAPGDSFHNSIPTRSTSGCLVTIHIVSCPSPVVSCKEMRFRFQSSQRTTDH